MGSLPVAFCRLKQFSWYIASQSLDPLYPVNCSRFPANQRILCLPSQCCHYASQWQGKDQAKILAGKSLQPPDIFVVDDRGSSDFRNGRTTGPMEASFHMLSSEQRVRFFFTCSKWQGRWPLAPAASPGSLSPPQDESPALFFFQNGYLADKSTRNNLK